MTDVGPEDAVDSQGADLSPRQPRPPRRSGGRRAVAWIITAGVVVAVTLLVVNLLGDASLFFYNADEAIERRVELGDDRFRVQGTPVEDTIDRGFRGDESVVVFSIVFEDAWIDVVHVGDPPELFQPGVPVVLEGAWAAGAPQIDGVERPTGDGWHFASDRMLVKHDNDYRDRDEYDGRVDEAERGGAAGADG